MSRRRHGLTYDRDLAARALAGADPRLARVIERSGPCALEARAGQPFDWLLRAIVGQQLSGRAAAAILGRLHAAAGLEIATPDAILTLSPDALRTAGLSRAKIVYVRELATAALDGTLPALAQLRRMDDEAVVERLTRLPGVGRWTVEMLLIFGLGRPDVLPLGDVGLRRGFARVFGERAAGSPSGLARRGERWRPWRSVASWYLWRVAGEPAPRRR